MQMQSCMLWHPKIYRCTGLQMEWLTCGYGSIAILKHLLHEGWCNLKFTSSLTACNYKLLLLLILNGLSCLVCTDF